MSRRRPMVLAVAVAVAVATALVPVSTASAAPGDFPEVPGGGLTQAASPAITAHLHGFLTSSPTVQQITGALCADACLGA